MAGRRSRVIPTGRAARCFTDPRADRGRGGARRQCSRPSAGSAAGTGGTAAAGCGGSAGGSTAGRRARVAPRRRDAERGRYGDALDFWRVTGVEPDRRLRSRAEMRLPGRGTARVPDRGPPAGGPRARCVQTAPVRLPRGFVRARLLVRRAATAPRGVRPPAPRNPGRRRGWNLATARASHTLTATEGVRAT